MKGAEKGRKNAGKWRVDADARHTREKEEVVVMAVGGDVEWASVDKEAHLAGHGQ